MSGLPEGNAPLTQADTFDQDWNAALAGEYPPPGSGQSQDQPDASVQSPIGQSAASPSPQPTPPAIPDHIAKAAREAGFSSVDEALAAARNFQSMRGQLPNLEEKWKKQHVEPLAQKLSTYEQREKDAWEQFLRVDPLSGFPRTEAERQAIIARRTEEDRAEEAQQAQAQAQARFRAEQEALQVERANVTEIQTNALKLVAINSLAPYRASLAKEHNVPESEIQQYMDATGMIEKVQSLTDLRGFGPLLEGLENHIRVRATQLQAQRQRDAKGRYRDVGTPAGSGGQSSAGRWERASEAEFDQAWARALRGELV